ncbi:MAG: diguanylate cyclase [Candidatus Omnitrophica bacterium]|nr:diguanylate cyclase [Candidatus Omnitrophota bacterium]
MAKILAVDDQEDNLELLSQILEDEDYNVAVARNGKEALEKAGSELPDVILLDINMPEMDGYEVCNRLKQNEKTKDIPVIFLTANTAEQSVVKGLDLGAYDYVTKPFNEKELLARISVMVRIRASEKKMETIAVTDSLTGLYNRRFLYQRFGEEIERARRNATALSCMMIDIDFFKKINDTYGHDVGDFVLKKLADILRTNVRGYDAIVRFGGEEFMVLFPGTTPEQAVEIGKKIRKEVEGCEFKKEEIQLNTSISIGVFGCVGTEVFNDVEKYIKCADEALYAAKNAGRNRVVMYEPK